MAKHGKAYRDRIKLVDKTQMLPLSEAISLLRKVKFAKFDETINLDLRLGVDPRNQDQQVRGTVALPHGTGKVVRVAVFAKGEKQKEAEDAGADIVGGDELAEKVLAGFLDFDKAIATPDMMRVVGRLGKVLGPRNMMPNPKAGTVTMDIRGAVEGLKAGRVEYRVDRLANMHVIVGKSSFSDEQLHDNISALMTAIWKAKPASAKGRFIRSVTLSSVMSPGIRLDMSTGEGTAA